MWMLKNMYNQECKCSFVVSLGSFLVRFILVFLSFPQTLLYQLLENLSNFWSNLTVSMSLLVLSPTKVAVLILVTMSAGPNRKEVCWSSPVHLELYRCNILGPPYNTILIYAPILFLWPFCFLFVSYICRWLVKVWWWCGFFCQGWWHQISLRWWWLAHGLCLIVSWSNPPLTTLSCAYVRDESDVFILLQAFLTSALLWYFFCLFGCLFVLSVTRESMTWKNLLAVKSPVP